MLELQNKTVVVTGASGGIGAAMIRQFAEAGAHCLVHAYRGRDRAEALARFAEDRGSDSAVFLADLSEASTRHDFAEKCWSWRNGVDVWVNNAGVDVLTGDAAKLPFDKKLHRLWQLDVAGTIDLSRTVGARMKKRGTGVIINIGWDQAWQGMAGDSGELFAAIKGAVMSFSLSLAQTLAPEVRVNCLAPGWIRTSWGERASDPWQDRAVGESLKSRWGTPEDVAQAALFLASPASDFINGQVVNVNGGFRFHRPT